jgi:hypothetical protein
MSAQHTPGPVTVYNFGPLQLRIRGLGVYFGGDLLAQKVAAFDLQTTIAINREAWKQKRAAGHASGRVNNITVHGWGPYERAAQHHNVAAEVCRATWKHICQLKGTSVPFAGIAADAAIAKAEGRA